MDGSLDRSLGGFTELRVHGVSGTPPETMLDHPHPVLVAGDATAGFYRRWYPGGGGDDVPGSRHREAYSWRGLTSGSGWRALWLLLLPFMLVNVAVWMLPTAGRRQRAWAQAWSERLLRLIALSLTCTLVLAFAGPAMDLMSWQCAGSATCVHQHGWLGFLASGILASPGRRVATASLLPLALVGLVWWLGSRTWRNYEAFNMPPDAGAVASGTPMRHPAFWEGFGPVGRLRSLHVTAAVAMLAALVATGAARHDGSRSPARLLQLLDLVVLVGATVAVLLQRVAKRSAAAEDSAAADRLGLQLMLLRSGALGLLGASLVVAAWPRSGGWTSAGSLPGLRTMLDVCFAGQFVALLAFTGTVAVQTPWRTAERDPGWRPAMRGMSAPVVVALAWLLAQAFAAGLFLRIGDYLGRPYPTAHQASAASRATAGVLADPAAALTDRLRAVQLGAPLVIPAGFYWAAAETLVFCLVAALIGAIVWRQARVRTRRGQLEVRAQYARQSGGEPPDPGRERWITGIARARAIASLTDSAGGALSILLAIASLLAVGGFGWHLLAPELINRSPWSALATGGTWAIAALAGALLALGRAAYTSPHTRRTLGIAWDLGSFWPRAAHPLSPPCYAERAVPDLVYRLQWLTRDPSRDRVVLSCHSQGTVLGAAAVLQLPAAVRARVGLVTYGSPLRRLYARYFPAYFGRTELVTMGLLLNPDGLDDRAADGSRVGPIESVPTADWRWRNLYRLTDPIGGWVVRPLPPDVVDVTDHPGVDQLCLDPMLERSDGDPAYPVIRAHSDYFADPQYEAVVAWVSGSIPGTAREDAISLPP